ncbi:CaaX protease [Xylariaceae sp. FL0804]|nr:CaaX protease [Xylariaceae sp. FL0804]
MPSIAGFLARYFTKEQRNTATAVALLVVYTLAYVVPFYLSRTTRPSPTLSRDAPSVIRARVASVSLTCMACSAVTYVILTSQGRATSLEALRAMGYWPAGLAEAARALLLTAVLFAGPLYETLVVDGAWRDWLSLRPVSELFSEWTTWRNIVAGPLTEEVLFRSASVPLLLAARASPARTCLLAPLVFGLAHLHHYYEFRLAHPAWPAAAALARSLLQLAYTSLFGAYACLLFLRTGSLLAICLVHAFCNVMGLPRFWGRVDPPPPPPPPPTPAAAGAGPSGSGGGSVAIPAEPSIVWTVVYYVLLVGGAAGWYRNLGTLTESPNALVPISI